ncbi:MAG TPA: hypothetical protein VIM41_05745, partial [Gammaproteobacteria bacterium]
PHPAGALRATGFVPGESVDCGHPWPQTPPAGDTRTALTYAAHGVSSYAALTFRRFITSSGTFIA